MDLLRQSLWQAAHDIAKVRPMLGTYLHVLLSALFVIYTGAHASLTRPSSAAKPTKKKNKNDDDDNDDDDESRESLHKMEGLSPSDAIIFPVLAGATLAGLYLIIKWLEDPAILNAILNWYFAVFGLLGIAKLLTDAMGVITSLVFPSKYTHQGTLWEINPKQRVAIPTTKFVKKRASPLPGRFSNFQLWPKLVSILWKLRELPSRQLHVRAYVYHILEASLHIGPQGCLSFVLALAAILYFNLVTKPWWLTNLLGYSFAYASLQLMSPTTFSTGSLILAALFVYDIYFVFYTPLMVTVATQLDIPAKMLFPRPPSPKDDPTKPSLAMLGLGDIVLPGLVIGFALRFDLYLFYLRKQKRSVETQTGDNISADAANKTSQPTAELIKAEYRNATGGWGERFWIGKRDDSNEPANGGTFPKTYFYACIYGYIAGMVMTLGVMSIWGQAQPALLYLVPGVLGSLWLTAWDEGDLKTMWEYDESEPEDTPDKKSDEPKKTLKSIFSWSRQDEISRKLEDHLKGDSDSNDSTKAKDKSDNAEGLKKRGKRFFKDGETGFFFLSISLPGNSSDDSKPSSKGTRPKPRSESSVEEELWAAFEDKMADTPPSTRTRSMRKSILNGSGDTPDRRPEKRLKHA